MILRKAAQKNLEKIDQRRRMRINIVLFELSKNPYLGKQLEGEFFGFYSLRVWPYRIVYEIIKNQLIIYVVQIKHRQGAYK